MLVPRYPPRVESRLHVGRALRTTLGLQGAHQALCDEAKERYAAPLPAALRDTFVPRAPPREHTHSRYNFVRSELECARHAVPSTALVFTSLQSCHEPGS